MDYEKQFEDNEVTVKELIEELKEIEAAMEIILLL